MNAKPTAIFMMGGPASGKSTVRSREFSDMTAIDCDLIKESHHAFDPKNPSDLHEWSSTEATKQVFASIGKGESFVFDGTGSTAEKYVRFIQAAQQAGFETEVVYVPCDLQTALTRNAARSRTVSEATIREKYSMMSTSFEIVSRYADRVRIVKT